MLSSPDIVYLDHPLASGNPPLWASAWGEDDCGPWAEFCMDNAVQRMRWILPGPYQFGSPEEERGRVNWEFLQRKVALTQGFWIFDTPCTQQLWTAVMDDNPSHFDGEQRPVEQVSWEDCKKFLTQLNARLNGLSLSLPTELQWEIACRAGTTTPLWNTPGQFGETGFETSLEQIAWYKANSASETHDVRQKDPNLWGLYDMLGNVWEWCDDAWQETVDSESSARRVIRGGSWGSSAQGVRAAFRYWFGPSNRDDLLGFRCSSSSSGSGEEPERSGRSRRGAGGDSGVESDEHADNT